jgi:cytochrome d ubiquinol oxidase subunit I
MDELQKQDEQKYGRGNYIPNVKLVYWSMRVMAYLATLLAMLALWGAWLLRRDGLGSAKWFQRAAIVSIAFPFLCNFAGWILTEAGRQPWVVYGLLKTSDAVSPTSSTLMVGGSLAVFMTLYAALGVADFILMRRYARLDPPEIGVATGEEAALPAPTY